ncbi:hypothetical protein GCM10007978_34710 [Shewanella hanedai]|uniref:hypothetical protein n=1 Tax=Shewanella hanedai TaxID=25 RepID=UPI00163D8970|nr:hypothetical protein [Shewanella hanedai]GGI94184.1 hypothetical protein GCM10007978_34710 [Shewanella hanedai]
MKLKWTIKKRLEVVYTGTLKVMKPFTARAILKESDGSIYGESITYHHNGVHSDALS